MAVNLKQSKNHQNVWEEGKQVGSWNPPFLKRWSNYNQEVSTGFILIQEGNVFYWLAAALNKI